MQLWKGSLVFVRESWSFSTCISLPYLCFGWWSVENRSWERGAENPSHESWGRRQSSTAPEKASSCVTDKSPQTLAHVSRERTTIWCGPLFVLRSGSQKWMGGPQSKTELALDLQIRTLWDPKILIEFFAPSPVHLCGAYLGPPYDQGVPHSLF